MTGSADLESPTLRIGVVCPYDLAVPGGVQSHVIDMVAAMRASGVQMHVLAPVSEPAGLARRFGQWPSWLTSAGESRSVAINGSVAPVRIAAGQREHVQSWARERDIHVLHVHEPFVPALARPAINAAAGMGIPVVGTFHASVDSTRLLQIARPWLRRTAERLSSAIAVSEMAVTTLRTIDPDATFDIDFTERLQHRNRFTRNFVDAIDGADFQTRLAARAVVGVDDRQFLGQFFTRALFGHRGVLKFSGESVKNFTPSMVIIEGKSAGGNC